MNYFLLCAYNEAENILKVIKDIEKNFRYEYKIIIVNDGSTDSTEQLIRTLSSFGKNIVLLTHKKNLGLGRALKTGFFFILKNNLLSGSDTIITLDADNTHSVEIANLMIEKFLENKDLVIASRFIKGAKELGVPCYRKFLSLAASMILRIIFPYPNIRDYTCGYRLYSGRVLLEAYKYYKEDLITERDFVCQLEILVKLLKLKPQTCEVPIILKYFLKSGKSKLKIVKNIISYLKFIFLATLGRVYEKK